MTAIWVVKEPTPRLAIKFTDDASALEILDMVGGKFEWDSPDHQRFSIYHRQDRRLYADLGRWITTDADGEFMTMSDKEFWANFKRRKEADDNKAVKPEIVVLCGSTRFYDAFQKANYELTMKGKIVLSVGFYPHAVEEAGGHGEGVGHDSEEKVALDELHKRKIDLADYVYVLNVGGYIGESTRSEIEYAEALGRKIVYLNETKVAQ